LKIGAFTLCVLFGTFVFVESASAQSTPNWITAPARYAIGDIHPGDILKARARNVGADLAVTCGGKPVDNLESSPEPASPSITNLIFILPQIDPGFVSCKLRSGGMESPSSSRILVMDAGNTLTVRLPGQALYQKLEVTDNGLDTEHTTMKPIRNALIEVVDVSSQRVISQSESESNGDFLVPVPPDATNLVIRAVSRLSSLDLKVEDNTNGNRFYYIYSPVIDMREPHAKVPVVDRSRTSGAFNILEQIQRANDFVHAADPQFGAFPFTIFWSERNQKKSGSIKDGLVGTTFFSLPSGTAYVLGDRNTDSDEYDDSVLIHEYAHMLAAKFSRDDSIGGEHRLGDNLDPRVAWSEGWANFFSCAVRNDSIYRDSSGPGGANVLRFDLEENYPPNSWTGYGSETSVQALLWDFLDDKSELADTAQFDFSQIWTAFTDLSSNHFVYLQYFLDHMIIRNPSASDSIQRMAQAQAIDFQPDVIPSITNPFPSFIAMNSSRPGELDSLSPKRTNLAQSSHFFVFTTNGGPVSIQLSVGLGTTNNPSANDLDLYLFDLNGKQISKSDNGLNQGELIPSVPLLPGAYVIEVRSYFTNNKGSTVFNSGHYNLRLTAQ